MEYSDNKLVQSMRKVLAENRQLLAQHDDLLQKLVADVPMSEMRDYRQLEKALRDTPVGDWLLAADSGTAEEREAAKERVKQALLERGTQEKAVQHIVGMLVAALDWDKPAAAADSELDGTDGVSDSTQELPPVEEPAPAMSTWNCICGRTGNEGQFCVSCGRTRANGDAATNPPLQQPAYQAPAQPAYGQPVYQAPPSPYQAPPPPQADAGSQGMKIALIAVIVVLAGVLLYFGVHEYSSQSPAPAATQASSSSQPKSSDQAKPKKADAPAAGSQRTMRTDLSLGGIDLDDPESVMSEVEGGRQANDVKPDNGLMRYYYDNMQIVTRNNMIQGLVSNDNVVATKRGIHQGSSFADVKNAYGTNYYKTGLGDNLTAYEYEFRSQNGHSGLLRFAINDDNHRVDYISVRLTD